MSSQYDVLILGRGAAAYAAAIKASELSEGDVSIAMVGTGPIGGTCVNVGCVPSKYLLEASHSHFYPQRPRFAGIEPSHPNFNFTRVMEGVRRLVSGFREAKYEKILKSYPNVEIVEGKARFRSSTEVAVANGTKVIRGKEHNHRHRFKAYGPSRRGIK
jgi:mercuric reductase